MNPGQPAPSDESLMQAYGAGDLRAFETLYGRHKTWLFRVIARQIGDTARAQDVFQETWLTVVRRAGSWQPTARFTTWLYTLARSRVIDQWRVFRPESEFRTFNPGVDRDDADSGTGDEWANFPDLTWEPATHAERNQLMERLSVAIGRLPSEQAEVFMLWVEGGMSLAEIALATASEEEAVKSRLRYARSKLAGQLKDWHA